MLVFRGSIWGCSPSDEQGVISPQVPPSHAKDVPVITWPCKALAGWERRT